MTKHRPTFGGSVPSEIPQIPQPIPIPERVTMLALAQAYPYERVGPSRGRWSRPTWRNKK